MSEVTGKPSTRLEPETAWTLVTDSPLRGLSLAREAGTILVWDEGSQLYLFDREGESHSISRVPNKIVAGTISDDGSLIALLVDTDEAGLMLLDADFNVLVERRRSVRADVHGGRSSWPIYRRWHAVKCLALSQPFRSPSRPSRNNGGAVASVFRARPGPSS